MMESAIVYTGILSGISIVGGMVLMAILVTIGFETGLMTPIKEREEYSQKGENAD